MATQFRKSFGKGPFRVTASKSGLSYSAGVKGARISKGADGKVRRTVGIPGTGIYNTKIVGGGKQSAPAAPPANLDALADQFAVDLVSEQSPEQQKALYDGYLADPQATLRTVRTQLVAAGQPAQSVDIAMPGLARYMDRWTGQSGTAYVAPGFAESQRTANAAWKDAHPRLWKALVRVNVALFALLALVVVLVIVSGSPSESMETAPQPAAPERVASFAAVDPRPEVACAEATPEQIAMLDEDTFINIGPSWPGTRNVSIYGVIGRTSMLLGDTLRTHSVFANEADYLAYTSDAEYDRGGIASAESVQLEGVAEFVDDPGTEFVACVTVKKDGTIRVNTIRSA